MVISSSLPSFHAAMHFSSVPWYFLRFAGRFSSLPASLRMQVFWRFFTSSTNGSDLFRSRHLRLSGAISLSNMASLKGISIRTSIGRLQSSRMPLPTYILPISWRAALTMTAAGSAYLSIVLPLNPVMSLTSLAERGTNLSDDRALHILTIL